ncbi:MAG: hypothetical protein JO333_13230 [Verrucomicrobia bacterium]|nr:hypothetical protein [Verrucomicrobiota bacterium]
MEILAATAAVPLDSSFAGQLLPAVFWIAALEVSANVVVNRRHACGKTGQYKQIPPAPLSLRDGRRQKAFNTS